MSNAYTSGFTHDVFVSYASVDDQPIGTSSGEFGWVSDFVTMLQRCLDQRLGRKDVTRLFFDRETIEPSQKITEQLKEAICTSATMVVIYSAGYINSQWCLDQLRAFDRATQGQMAEAGRLFLVRLDEEQPEDLVRKAPHEVGDTIARYFENLIGYPFYKRDLAFPYAYRLDTKGEDFHRTLASLAIDLSLKLHSLSGADVKQATEDSSVPSPSSAIDRQDDDKFFISYRREDTPYAAELIYSALKAKFGEESLVFDVDTIPIGIDFEEYLRAEVNRCRILIAIIGDRWLDATGVDHKMRRIDEPEDWVRMEISTALNRGIPVIPVLVGNATVPPASNLPDDLKPLSRRNAAEVRAGRDITVHLELLKKGIDRLLGR